jgi:hypothetical protein
MSTFVSYFKTKVGRKTHYLYLNDYLVYQTKRGKELQDSDKSNDLSGHGCIYFYYNIKKDHFHHEESDFSNPKNFPPPIRDDIKNMKMVKISSTIPNWRNLLSLLNEKVRDKLFGFERPLSSLSFVKNLKPVKGKEKLAKEVKPKLIRIVKNKEAGFNDFNWGGSKYIIKYFIWQHTKEGKNYWEDLMKTKIFTQNTLPKDISNCKFDSMEMNKKIWELFKDKANRNPLWV